MKTLELYLDIDPAELPTAQQKGITRTGRVYTKPKVKEAQRLLYWHLKGAGRRIADRDGAFSVYVCYCYRPSVFPRRLWGAPKITRPDCDNLTKLLLDVIAEAGIAFVDDAQVAELVQVKRYVNHGENAPHIAITIKKMEDAQ